MSAHVTRHPSCVETVQVVPTRDEVRITRFVEFAGTTRLACELVMLTWAQARHVRDSLDTYYKAHKSTQEVPS